MLTVPLLACSLEGPIISAYALQAQETAAPAAQQHFTYRHRHAKTPADGAHGTTRHYTNSDEITGLEPLMVALHH
jgi:hypothetical protein